MASLRAPVPLLAQELLEFVHHLLRVEVVLAPWARHIPGRIIVVLSLPDIGLDGSVFRDGLVTLGPKGPHGRLERGDIQRHVE
jgi:hypothetical protein